MAEIGLNRNEICSKHDLHVPAKVGALIENPLSVVLFNSRVVHSILMEREV